MLVIVLEYLFQEQSIYSAFVGVSLPFAELGLPCEVGVL